MAHDLAGIGGWEIRARQGWSDFPVCPDGIKP